MKIDPIIMCIFIFLIVICTVEAIDKIVVIIKRRRHKKLEKIECKINNLSLNQIRAILGYDPIGNEEYKSAREILENWPEGCPKPNNNEIRKYFGFPLEKEENDGN